MRNSHLLVLAFALVACGTALSQPQQRVALTFSGTTSASHLLIKDVMQNVMDFGDTELGCAMPDYVDAEVMPEGFQPAVSDAAPEGAGPPIYERWMVSFCGSRVPVLLTFWTMEQGGTAFDVQYSLHEMVSVVEDGGTLLQ